MIMDETELVFGEKSYELRIVSYFDILGWRSEVLDAGDDARRIARLAAIPRLFSSSVWLLGERVEGAFITAFSDNVVTSVPYRKERVQWSLEGLATIQFALALAGFWSRGAITVGRLFHDADTVFGPALNRVYELESRSAIYPRTLIDPEVSVLMNVQSDFIACDAEWRFTDPFTMPFIRRKQNEPINRDMVARYNELSGTAIPMTPVAIDPMTLLLAIFLRVRSELSGATSLGVWQKYAWLYDRIAPRVGCADRSTEFAPPRS